MTLLPGTNYMSNAARNEAEMKVALDKVNEVIAEIGSQDVTTLTIDALGAITTPLSSMVSVMPEGAGVADTLSSIGVSNIDKGRMVILQHDNPNSNESSGITINHGTGAGTIEMKDSMDFILCSKRMLCLIYTGATGHWKEVWRGYGRSTAEEKLAERVDMGLGTASVEDIAVSAAASEDKVLKVKTGTNLEADDVLAVNTSGQIGAATITTNATTLNGQPSTEYVRKTGGAAQSIDDDLTVATTNASLIADGTSTAALRLKATVGAITKERAFIELVAADGEMTIGTIAAGGAATVGMKFDPAAGSAGSGGRIVSGVGDIVADIIEANLVSAGDASAGSFRVSAGTTNLLVQWGGASVFTSSVNNPWSNSTGYYRITFPENATQPYTSTPHIIGASYSKRAEIFLGTNNGYQQETNVYGVAVTTTHIEWPAPPSGLGYLDSTPNPDVRYFYRAVGNYIAIGIVA